MYTAGGVSYNGCQNALAPALIVILLHCQKDTSMKRTTICIAIVCTLFCLAVSCRRASEPPHRGIYHWKTTYDPTDWELQFIKEHNIDSHCDYIASRNCTVGAKVPFSVPLWKGVAAGRGRVSRKPLTFNLSACLQALSTLE